MNLSKSIQERYAKWRAEHDHELQQGIEKQLRESPRRRVLVIRPRRVEVSAPSGEGFDPFFSVHTSKASS
jgi:hypothetical protein